RKREVTTDFSQAERKPHKIQVTLTAKEREEYDKVIEEYTDDNSYYSEFCGDDTPAQGASLGLVQKKRQIASSVFAYLNTEEDLDNGIDRFKDYEDAKFEELINIIEEVFKHGSKKIVIFALFRKTLKFLQLRFRKRGYGTLIIHGHIENRAEILDEFKNNPNAHILLSSEVGSEGLDMQFCNSMVNYDLPWNPMVVEQRIGRIDRFGQQSPIVNIYNIIVADSIQEEIYMRLLERIGIFKGTIGDMEAILDATFEDGKTGTIKDAYNKLEKELYTTKLTEEERNRKLREIEQAIANEKENIKHLEEGLDNTLTNDAYFRDEINRILFNNSYVTEIELRNYIESIIRDELTTCSLVEVDEGIYEFQLPAANSRVLSNFLTSYQPEGDEYETYFHQFKQKIEDIRNIRITFNQEKAYDSNKVIFVNMYHPIIQAAVKYYQKKSNKLNTSFCYALNSDKMLKPGEVYYLAVYKISFIRKIMGVKKHSEKLVPILFCVDNRSIVTNEDLITHVFSISHTQGNEYNPKNEDINSEMLQDMRYDIVDAMDSERKKLIEELMLQVESDIQRNVQQTEEYYDSIIQNINRQISNMEYELKWNSTDEKRASRLLGTIRLMQGQIKKIETTRDEKINQIKEAANIEVNEEMISLNLIYIV
ncbi:MAG: DEAD/DEAH box helicase, partial [Muribaculaceae bacterium]